MQAMRELILKRLHLSYMFYEGYWGMLGHELTDAKMYADWGIDFVKLDLGCQSDSSIHDGTAMVRHVESFS